MAPRNPISVPAVCSQQSTPFSQTLIANLDNAFEIKHALLEGALPFHNHPDHDEAFYLLSGELTLQVFPEGEQSAMGAMESADAEDVKMKVGDCYTVRKGIVHRPVGTAAHILIMEKIGVPGGNGHLANGSE